MKLYDGGVMLFLAGLGIALALVSNNGKAKVPAEQQQTAASAPTEAK